MRQPTTVSMYRASAALFIIAAMIGASSPVQVTGKCKCPSQNNYTLFTAVCMDETGENGGCDCCPSCTASTIKTVPADKATAPNPGKFVTRAPAVHDRNSLQYVSLCRNQPLLFIDVPLHNCLPLHIASTVLRV